ncbi:hypothetical protein [Kineococcus gypseus]|uniref:hypothetical protein n=1 Tax=Kineococcus gypseus TaxID=1637102 RepID=UPI003D7CFD55
MDVLTGVLAGVLAVAGLTAGAGALIAGALVGGVAGAGRDEDLLVAPRGTGFGGATRLVLEAGRAGRAPVVHLDAHRARGAGGHLAA